MANLRRDGLHKLTTRIAAEHAAVVVEDLNVTGMLANRRLARHIADAGFAEIRRQLAYKTQWNGGRLIVADRWYPSSKTCSGCGAVKPSSPCPSANTTARPAAWSSTALFAPRCVSEAAHPATFAPSPNDEVVEPDEGRRIPPPRCGSCGSLVRLGVVWFGEALPEDALAAAVEAAAACDVLLAVGTSGVVYPAAEIPRIAASSGATVLQVNPEPTSLDRVCAMNLRGTAGQLLPTLVTAAWSVAHPG